MVLISSQICPISCLLFTKGLEKTIYLLCQLFLQLRMITGASCEQRRPETKRAIYSFSMKGEINILLPYLPCFLSLDMTVRIVRLHVQTTDNWDFFQTYCPIMFHHLILPYICLQGHFLFSERYQFWHQPGTIKEVPLINIVIWFNIKHYIYRWRAYYTVSFLMLAMYSFNYFTSWLIFPTFLLLITFALTTKGYNFCCRSFLAVY